MKNKIYIIIMLMLVCNLVFGQEIKLAAVEYNNYSPALIKDETDNKKVSFREAGALVNIPLRLKDDKTIIINGLRFAYVQSETDNDATNSANKSNFKTFRYTLGLIHKFNNGWMTTLMLMPTLSGDFKNGISSDDFIMQGSFVLSKKMNEYSILGGGIAYNTNLGKPMPIPLLQFRYTKNRHQVNVLLPMLAEYQYAATTDRRLKLGLRSALNGAYFNYTAESNVFGTQEKIDKVNYSRLNTSLLANYRLGKQFEIEVSGGVSSFRKYRLKDNDGNELKFDSKAAGFVNIGFSYVLPETKK
ncbi:MAG: DUF6268 family outer membrane beta-barrel protein [Chryseobacterium taeanense]